MNEEQFNIGFSLKKITTKQFAIIESAYKREEKITLETKLSFGVSFEEKIISVSFLTKFVQKEIPFLLIEVACHFEIEEMAWEKFLNESKTEILFPKGFINHLVMLTIGTTRGVLHSKTENTPFNSFLLPTIHVNTLLKEDEVFHFTK
jgi:hypothetical protein